MNLVLGHLGVPQDLLHWGDGLLEHAHAEFLELGSGDGEGEVLGLGEGVDLDGGQSGGGQNSLGLFGLGSETPHGSGVASDVNSLLLEEVSAAVLDELVVEIFTSQVSISSGGLDLEHTLVDGQEGNIKCSSSQVEDQHVLLSGSLLVETIGDGGRSGLVDDSQDVKSGNGAGILGGLSLVVTEVSRHGDDCVLAALAKEGLSGLSHLGEDHGGDLLSVEFLGFSLGLDDDDGLVISAGFHLEGPVLDVLMDDGVIELPADESLGIEDGVVGVFGGLVLGGVSDEPFGVSEGNIGWGGSVSLIVGDDLHSLVLPDTHTGVGGSQIDSDSFSDDFLVSHCLSLKVFYNIRSSLLI